MTIYEKKEHIKTAVFEAKIRSLIKDIKETDYITKTGILKAIERFEKECIEYEEPKFEILKELRI